MQRFTIGDAAELAGDVGPDQRLIGVLAELDAAVDLQLLRAQVSERVGRQPILSRRFVRHGKATWSATWEQTQVDVADQVLEVATDEPVATAAAVMTRGLPETTPMWRLLVLRSPGATHLLFVAHHALLDGTSAVAVVGALLGGDEPPPPSARPRRRWTTLPAGALGLLAAMTRGSSATTLLTPLTSGFRLVSVEVALGPARDAARRAGATLNDLLLVAVGEALRVVAARRGERLRRVVVSVPVTGRPGGAGGRNQVGAFLVSVPERRPGETDREFLGRLAVRTRRRKTLARAASEPVALSATLAGLGRLGWYRPMFERQRAITTLVTNLRGPADPLMVLGARVRSLTPVSPALGNVTVVFAALSHAGRLRVTARLDRSMWKDDDLLADALGAALTRLSANQPEADG